MKKSGKIFDNIFHFFQLQCVENTSDKIMGMERKSNLSHNFLHRIWFCKSKQLIKKLAEKKSLTNGVLAYSCVSGGGSWKLTFLKEKRRRRRRRVFLSFCGMLIPGKFQWKVTKQSSQLKSWLLDEKPQVNDGDFSNNCCISEAWNIVWVLWKNAGWN